MIKYAQGDCSIEEIQQVKEAFEYGYFGMAGKVIELELKIKEFLGTDRHIACVNTGTSALHIALDSIGIKEGDEVILPSFTFVATAQAITACGGKPVFVDLDKNTLTIDCKKIEEKITKHTKAIIVVHYNGQPVDMDSILSLAKRNNLRVIEDAAHAFGSFYKGLKIGSFGDITCFSFDSIKIMTCGEGGAVLSNDEHVIEEIKMKRLLGMKRESKTIGMENRTIPYDVVTSGYRYHMSNINAAIGLAQIKKVHAFIEYRRELVKKYRNLLANSKIINFFDFNYETNAHFMMPVKVLFGYRDELKQFLAAKDIETNISYIPIHKFSFYEQICKDEFPNTEEIYNSILSLPLHTKLSIENIEYIANSILEFENEKINTNR